MANYQQAAKQFALKYGLKPGIFLKQIRQESGFNPNAVSPAGAQGIAQFMAATARGMGVNPRDPISSLDGAARLMAQYVKRYGNYRDALVAYNAGPGTVGKPLPAETQAYVRNILGGQNPAATGGAARTTTTTSTTSITPQAQRDRRAALAQFVLAGANADPLKLATDYAALGKQTQTTTRVKATGGEQAIAAPAQGSGRYPLGRRGKDIGSPYQGTHAKAFNVAGGSDNWQSENAVDISIPVGTPVYAVADGVLGNTGSLGQGGRFAGLRTNLIGKNNAWYYAHLSRLAAGIHAGAHVRRGQLLGYSGEANGVAHLHFAQQKGDPRRLTG